MSLISNQKFCLVIFRIRFYIKLSEFEEGKLFENQVLSWKFLRKSDFEEKFTIKKITFWLNLIRKNKLLCLFGQHDLNLKNDISFWQKNWEKKEKN